jgi:hypothetical protein
MAIIGKLEARRIRDNELVYEGDILNLTITGGRVFLQIDGGYLLNLSLQKGQLYALSFKEMDAMEGLALMATFEDYVFNAGATDYVDDEGNRTTGTCVLSNQLQFLLIE